MRGGIRSFGLRKLSARHSRYCKVKMEADYMWVAKARLKRDFREVGASGRCCLQPC
jgi:hypothetical protein